MKNAIFILISSGLAISATVKADWVVDYRECHEIPGESFVTGKNLVRFAGPCEPEKPLQLMGQGSRASEEYWVGSYRRAAWVRNRMKRNYRDSCNGQFLRSESWIDAHLVPYQWKFSLRNPTALDAEQASFGRLPMTESEAAAAMSETLKRCESGEIQLENQEW